MDHDVDADAEREIDPVEGEHLPDRLASADAEATEADTLDQRRVVPLDDPQR